MNKTLLIIICDFLLISLLSLARFDVEEAAPEPSPIPVAPAGVEEDLSGLWKIALEEERHFREQLAGQLAQTRETVVTQEHLLAQGAEGLRQIHESLRRREEELRKIERERAALRDQFTASRAGAEALERALREMESQAESQAELSRERLEALQAELRAREAESDRLRQQIAEAETSRARLEGERRQLATRLEVTETEQRLAEQHVQFMREEVQVVREEKVRIQEQAAHLAEGVSALAVKSEELTEEIRQHRPMAANAIFSEFVANRVQSDFLAIRTGLLGREIVREKETRTVLVSDGSGAYALFHVQDTPLALADPGTDWNWLTANVRHRGAIVPARGISFLQADPRVVLVPVTPLEAEGLGSKVYSLSSDPYKFQEAVLVGANEGYYGECKFQLDPALPQYVRMERSAFRALFGRFAPTRGDLVFSKTGELLGIMVNHEYCLVLSSFSPVRTITTGTDVARQQTGRTLSSLRAQVDRMPLKLH